MALLSLLALLPTPALAWQASINGDANVVDEARAVAVAQDGSILATGIVENNIIPGPGDPPATTPDFVVVKLDANDGSVLWTVDIAGPEDRNAEGNDVIGHPDGGAVAVGMIRFRGNSKGHFTVAKLASANGADVWRRGGQVDDEFFGNEQDDTAHAVTVDSAGNVLVTGNIDEGPGTCNDVVASPGCAGLDIFVVKLDGATGSTLWKRQIGSLFDDTGFAITADAADHVLVVGKLNDEFIALKLDGATGALDWATPLGTGQANALSLFSGGDVAVAGTVSLDYVVARLSASDGSLTWMHQRDGSVLNNDVAFDVVVDSADNVISAGTWRNPGNQFLVVKLNGATGALVWGHEIPGLSAVPGEANALALNAAQDVLAVGMIEGPVPPDTNFAIVKLANATGFELQRREFSGSAGVLDIAMAVAIDASGNVAAAGHLDNTGGAEDFTVVKVSGLDLGDAICGDGITAGLESCDEGDANGTASSCCAIDCTLRPAGEVCRESLGACDANTCDGASGVCPMGVFLPATTECRPSAGLCDVAETCTGAGVAGPADGFVAAATECAPATGVCDVAVVCTGASAACPADGPNLTSECRASAGVCDVAESCSDASDDCPVDGFVAAATECAPATGVCDVAEVCTGASTACPADGPNLTSECRASAGVRVPLHGSCRDRIRRAGGSNEVEHPGFRRDASALAWRARGRLRLTLELARRSGKPHLHIHLDAHSLAQAAQRLRDWLALARPRVLNVAGPRNRSAWSSPGSPQDDGCRGTPRPHGPTQKRHSP